MAVKGLLRSWSGGGARQEDNFDRDVAVVKPGDTKRRLEIIGDVEDTGISWFWAADAEHRLIYLSANGAEKLGRPLEELLGQSLLSMFETDPDNPDERSDRPLKFQLSARSKLSDLVVRFALGKARTDGRQAWWSLSGHPKLDANGDLIGYRGSAKDVTIEYERKLEDSKLAEYDSLTGL